MVLGSVAGVSVPESATWNYITSGGLNINGSAISAFGNSHFSTGGLVIGGTAGSDAEAPFSHTATGGLVIGGEVVVEFGFFADDFLVLTLACADAEPCLVHVVTGGLTIGWCS